VEVKSEKDAIAAEICIRKVRKLHCRPQPNALLLHVLILYSFLIYGIYYFENAH